MINIDEINDLLSKSNISEDDIKLVSDYFMSLYELKIIKDRKQLILLVNRVINELDNIVYYDNNDEELLKKLKISKNNKGLQKDNVIYVNKNMSDDLVVITLYHELTHFLQRYKCDNSEHIGVMKNFKWRLLMEAQTQNIAELIYSHIYNEKQEDVEYKSEDLRMLSGGTIISNLRNYQMYDHILKKICLVLNLSVEEFISINFNNEKSIELFEKIINEKCGYETTEIIIELLDIIYSTDVIIYTSDENDLPNPTICESLIDGRRINVSSYNQFRCIMILDKLLLMLSKNDIYIYSKLLDSQFIKKEKYIQKSPDFSEVSHAKEDEVEKNPERFIMQECISACKELWSKNIYTFMTSNYIGESGIWIEIYNELSNENLNYLKSLKEKGINIDIYHDGCYRINVNHIGEKASELLKIICQGFVIQDVPKNIAYLEEHDFLMECGCYDEILNPNYYEMKESYELEFSSFAEQLEYLEKYNEWLKSDNSKKYIKVFNIAKKNKTVEEYAKERNMIYENNRVYLSKFDYDKHMKYIKNNNDMIDEQIYSTHYENGVEYIYQNV